jgi:hypothetical protein
MAVACETMLDTFPASAGTTIVFPVCAILPKASTYCWATVIETASAPPCEEIAAATILIPVAVASAFREIVSASPMARLIAASCRQRSQIKTRL